MGLGIHTEPGPVLGLPTSMTLGIQAWKALQRREAPQGVGHMAGESVWRRPENLDLYQHPRGF